MEKARVFFFIDFSTLIVIELKEAVTKGHYIRHEYHEVKLQPQAGVAGDRTQNRNRHGQCL